MSCDQDKAEEVTDYLKELMGKGGLTRYREAIRQRDALKEGNRLLAEANRRKQKKLDAFRAALERIATGSMVPPPDEWHEGFSAAASIAREALAEIKN